MRSRAFCFSYSPHAKDANHRCHKVLRLLGGGQFLLARVDQRLSVFTKDMAAGTQLDELSQQYLSHPVYVAQERAVLSAERDAYPNLGQVKKDYDELQGLLRSASPGFAALHADKLQDLKSKYFNPSATAFRADVLSRLSSALQEPLTNYTRHFFPGGRINGKVQEVLAQLNAVNTSIPNIDSLGFSSVLGAEAEPLTEITSHAKIYISSLANFAPVMQSVVHGDRKGQSVNMSSQVAVQAVKAWLTLGAPLKSPWKDNAAMSRLYSHLQTFCKKTCKWQHQQLC